MLIKSFADCSLFDGRWSGCMYRSVIALLTAMGCGAHAGPHEPRASPNFRAGLWEYRQTVPTGSETPQGQRVFQCFDLVKTPWVVAAESGCEGFTRTAWERSGLTFKRSTAFRWEGEEFVADTLCAGMSRQTNRTLRIASGWSGDFNARLVISAAVEVGSVSAEGTASGAVAVPREPRGTLTRVADCPHGMKPGDFCGIGLDGKPSDGPACPQEVINLPR